jgi:hypothetical protein
MTRTTLLLTFVFLLTASLALAAPRPAFLALTPGEGESYGRSEVEYVPDQVAAALKERGWERGWHTGWKDLTLDYLKQFNAVILYDWPGSGPEGPPAETVKELDLLRSYAEQGGGLFLAQAPYWSKKAATANALLAPMGAKVYNELVKDPTTTIKIKSGLPFGWTDALEKSPLTAGVAGLFYGESSFEPGSPNTNPIAVSPDWQVVVRSLPTAASFTGAMGSNEFTGPGAGGTAPALVAARDWGKGRVVLWPMALSYTLLDGYAELLDKGVVMDEAAGGHKSDGARLCYNLLDWLMQPSQALPGWGGFIYTPVPPRTLDNEPGFIRFDWTKERPVQPMYGHAYRGLVGAMSNLSRGKAAPEELIAAAKAAGYEYVIFTEDLGVLKKDGWDKLVALCKARSDAHFAAFPGMYYKTVHGQEFIAFGLAGDISYPPADWTKQVDGETRVLENTVFTRGLATVPAIAMVYPSRNPNPLRVNSQFYGFATYTYEGGTLVDEAVQPYLELQREGLNLFTLAVHFVKDPAEVAAAAHGGMQAYIRARSLDTVPRSVEGFTQAPQNEPQWVKPGFASSGPEMQWLWAENWGTSDQAIPGNDRHRLQIMVSAPAGLREVRVYDNARLWERFLPHGQTVFVKQIDNYHDQQHSYVVEAIDMKGGQAISWGRETNVQEVCAGMCGDNWNDMPTGKYTHMAAGSEAGAKLYLRGTEMQEALVPTAEVWDWPSLPNFADGGYNYATLKRSGIVTRFGWILDYSLDHRYDQPGWPGGIYDAFGVVPNPYYRGTLRNYLIMGCTPKPNYTLLEGDVTFIQDTKVKATPGFTEAFLDGMLAQYAVPSADGKSETVAPSTPPATLTGTLAPNAYLATFPALAGLVNLGDKPLTYWLSTAAQRGPVGVGQGGETLPAGTRETWRLLALGGAHDNALVERVRSEMGLLGKTAYTVTSRVGRVESTRLFLRLKTDQGGWRGTISQADLPLVLPILVDGLNPNWSAGIWYRGKNTLLTPEWKLDPWRLEIIPEPGQDQILRVAAFHSGGQYGYDATQPAWSLVSDGVGFLTVDLQEKARDLFLGNLVTCDNPEIRLTFIRDPGRAYVVAHNPTGRDVTITVRPGKGFDLYGNWSKTVRVEGGSSVEVPVGD